MKILTTSILTIAALAGIGASTAFADDPQLPNRLAIQQAQNAPRAWQTTVAVYTDRGGIGRREVAANQETPEMRFELRTNPHGQTFGLWVEVR